ncbi:hypothetical protein C0J56_23780 [Pseudomonas fluorescens]|nr:hypothetical protein C0J56_23780 [Pseudomonas fluorescens]
MAQRGYPGIHAGMPTPQCLRSASVVNGALRSTSAPRRPDSRPGCGWVRVSPVGASLLARRPALIASSYPRSLWRGDLSPLGCAAAPWASHSICLMQPGCPVWGRFAPQRG